MKKNNLLLIFVALISISCSTPYNLTLPKTDVIILNEIGISTSVGGSFVIMNTFIYGLYYNDGVNDIMFYIGKADSPLKRFKQHLYSIKKKNNSVVNKMKSLIFNKHDFSYFIIDEVDKDNWIFWERFYISYFKGIGTNLKNITIGGEGGNTDPLNKRGIKIRKPVAQYDLNGVYIQSFISISNAAKYMKCSVSQIGESVKLKHETSNGFQWRYFNGDKSNIQKAREYGERPDVIAAAKKTSIRMKNTSPSLITRDRISKTLLGKYLGDKHSRSIPIVQLDIKTKEVIKYWESANLAATTLDIWYPNLLQAVKGKRNNAGGFCWAYPQNKNLGENYQSK